MFLSSKSLIAAGSAAVILAGVAMQGGIAAAQNGAAQTFIVLAPEGGGVSRASARVQATGGRIVGVINAYRAVTE